MVTNETGHPQNTLTMVCTCTFLVCLVGTPLKHIFFTHRQKKSRCNMEMDSEAQTKENREKDSKDI